MLDVGIVLAPVLLDLPEDVQIQVEAGRMAPSIADKVSRLGDPEEQVSRVESNNRGESRPRLNHCRGAGPEARPGNTARQAKQGFRHDDGMRIAISGRAECDPRGVGMAIGPDSRGGELAPRLGTRPMDRVTTVGQGRGSRLDLRCRYPGLFVLVAQQVSIIERIVLLAAPLQALSDSASTLAGRGGRDSTSFVNISRRCAAA